jgi:16S rRNA (uracil1498-N3)-methyltransferase
VKTFHLPPERWREPYELAGPEARHMLKVLRTRAGERVRLLDGQGREGLFTVGKTSKDRAELELVSVDVHPRPEPAVHLALGWVKSARRGWLLEKAVELGAGAIVFWQSARSQGRVPEKPKQTWQDKMVQAMKQCGNPWLPEIRCLPGGAGELACGGDYAGRFLLHEEQDEQSRPSLIDPSEAAAQGGALLVLGPEGGLAPEEIRTFADTGFLCRSLGRRVLRYETAALMCLGLAWWGAERSKEG